jgi:hypothetical protein
MINTELIVKGRAIIQEERIRQIEVKGFTIGHDDRLDYHQDLIMAAACYEMEPKGRQERPDSWPWDFAHWKPSATRQSLQGRLRELQKAGALYQAAFDQMELQGLEIPLKMAVSEKIGLMAIRIGEILAHPDFSHG